MGTHKTNSTRSGQMKGADQFYQGPLPDIDLPVAYRKILQVLINEPEIRYILVVAPRQSRKDIMCLMACGVYMNLDKPRHITYIGQSLKATREIIFDLKLADGEPYYSILGRVKPQRSSGMLTSANGSILQVYGCDRMERTSASGVVGRNSALYIFTEFGLQNVAIWDYIRPILTQSRSNSKVLFVTTPRGRNHVYDLMNNNKNNKEWLVLHYSMYDFEKGEYNIEEATKELERGMPQTLFRQEFLCEFDAMGDSGLVYSSYLTCQEQRGFVCPLKKVPTLPTYVAWDLGVSDSTVCIIFQYCVQTKQIWIIDMIEGSNKRMSDYYILLKELGYNYSTHFMPHDSKHETLHNPYNESIADQFRGILRDNDEHAKVITVPVKKVYDSINLVRENFHRFLIDSNRCKRLIDGCRRYKRKFNEKDRIYEERPTNRQEYRDIMDALKYMATSVVLYLDKGIYH